MLSNVYAECHFFVILCVIMLNVITLRVAAPCHARAYGYSGALTINTVPFTLKGAAKSCQLFCKQLCSPRGAISISP
jgi:hypothetical protein